MKRVQPEASASIDSTHLNQLDNLMKYMQVEASITFDQGELLAPRANRLQMFAYDLRRLATYNRGCRSNASNMMAKCIRTD